MPLLLKQLLITAVIVSPSFAGGFIIASSTCLTPLSVKNHKVTCVIENGVASTTVDQEFVNTMADAFAGGRYIFPVPPGAAIDQFKVVIDGEATIATVMSKDSARLFFRDAVKNSSQSSLLEYAGTAAYMLDIGPIAPGASRKIRISYVEILPKNDGVARYLYPLSTGRYSMKLIDTVSLSITIRNASAITSVYSPSFPVSINRISPFEASIAYTGVRTRPDRNFDLYYKLSDEAISFHLFPWQKAGEDGYFLMLITPKVREPDKELPAVPKDVVFTIDHSGSMAGTKITQARDALRFCVGRLLPRDYFNIIAFDNALLSNAAEMLPASAENVQQALSFVATINDAGSTDIAQALTTSLARIGVSERPHYCIFLTDGLPTAGVTVPAQICTAVNAANTTKTRIFSVGFGYDVNTVLIDKLSIDNGGVPLYCNPDQNIQEVISELYRRIESPVLTSPQLDIGATAEVWGVSPSKLPDLFSGSEIAVFGRYKGQGRCSLTLSGMAGEQADTMRFETEFPDTATLYSFVPRLWATRQIADLMVKIKLQTLTQDNLTLLVDSVKALSLAYGIVTPYTSSLFTASGSTSWSGALQTSNGKSANEASNYMQGMQQNSNASQTVIADTNALPVSVAPKLNQMQNAGNKIFVFTADSVWKDVVIDSTLHFDTISFGTDEYFSLAEQDPDLCKILAVGNRTAFTFNGKNYLVLDRSAAITRPDIHPAVVSLPAGVVKAIYQFGSTVRFTREAGTPGSIAIYSVNGSLAATMNFGAAQTVACWNTGAARGVYCAVYRSTVGTSVRKFLVR